MATPVRGPPEEQIELITKAIEVYIAEKVIDLSLDTLPALLRNRLKALVTSDMQPEKLIVLGLRVRELGIHGHRLCAIGANGKATEAE
jgi:hypothetical protein